MNEIQSVESIERVDYEEFRQKLAFGCVSENISHEDQENAKDFLIRFCSILPKFYGDELDRLKLWERISSGLDVLASKLSDTEEIVDIMLKHICADIAVSTADKSVRDFINEAPCLSIPAIKSVIGKKKLFILCKARESHISRFEGVVKYDNN